MLPVSLTNSCFIRFKVATMRKLGKIMGVFFDSLRLEACFKKLCMDTNSLLLINPKIDNILFALCEAVLLTYNKQQGMLQYFSSLTIQSFVDLLCVLDESKQWVVGQLVVHLHSDEKYGHLHLVNYHQTK